MIRDIEHYKTSAIKLMFKHRKDDENEKMLQEREVLQDHKLGK